MKLSASITTVRVINKSLYLLASVGLVVIGLASPATAVDNQTPFAGDVEMQTEQDSPVAIKLPGIDPDGEIVAYSIVEPPAHGEVIEPSGPYVDYTPNQGFSGWDGFSFSITDDAGASAVGNVKVEVVSLCDGKAVTHTVVSTQEGTFYGTSGDDVILGTSNADSIDGLGGNDTICAGDGDDYVFGNNGDDRIFLGSGNNLSYGGMGNDFIQGIDGNNVFYGGKGNDVLTSGYGLSTLSGGSGDDLLTTSVAGTNLWGGDGKDTIVTDTGAVYVN